MSTAYGTMDRATTSSDPDARQPLAGASGQQSGGSSSYVGVHRHDGHGVDPDDAQRRPGHRPRHRRLA
jgi:hypothetical protein